MSTINTMAALRTAILNASDGGTITLEENAIIDVSDAYSGTNALPTIDKSLTFEGNGATFRYTTGAPVNLNLFVTGSINGDFILHNCTIDGFNGIAIKPYVRDYIEIDGVIFKNGTNATNTYAIECGSGNEAQLIVKNCRFENLATELPIYINGTHSYFSQCHFENITNDYSILYFTGFSGIYDLFIDNCTFKNNSCNLDGHDGILHVYLARDFKLTNCEFQNNFSDQNIVYLQTAHTYDSVHTIKNCQFIGNALNGASAYAGCLHISGGPPSITTTEVLTVSISNNTFQGNEHTLVSGNTSTETHAMIVWLDVGNLVEFEAHNNTFDNLDSSISSAIPCVRYEPDSVSSDQTLDFRNNYWGHPDGPQIYDPNNLGAIDADKGDTISDNIIYEPYLSNPLSEHDGEPVYPFAFSTNDPYTTGNPISLEQAEKRLYEMDIVINTPAAPMILERVYRQNHQDVFDFMGKGWTHSHHIYLYKDDNVGELQVFLPRTTLKFEGSGTTWDPKPGTIASISKVASRYKLTFEDNTEYFFDQDASTPPGGIQERYWLKQHIFPSGEKWEYFYDDLSIADPKLTAVSDDYGNDLLFTYRQSGDFVGKLDEVKVDGTTISVNYFYTKHDTNTQGVFDTLLSSVNDVRGYSWGYDYYDNLSGDNHNLLHRRTAPDLTVLEDLSYTFTTVNNKQKISRIVQNRGGGLLQNQMDYSWANNGERSNRTTKSTAGIQELHLVTDAATIFTDGLGNQALNIKNTRQQLRESVDRNGNSTIRGWNSLDRTTDVTFPDSTDAVESYSYNGNGLITNIKDAQGYDTSYTYDGNLVTHILREDDGVKIRHQRMTYETAIGNAFRVSVEELLDSSNTALKTTNYTYHSSGNGWGLIASMTVDNDGDDIIFNYEYDELGRVVRIKREQTFGDCEYTHVVYDAAGNVLFQVCSPGTNSTYASVSDMQAIYNAYPDETRVTQYIYDDWGRVARMILHPFNSALKMETRYVYDALSRVILTVINYTDTTDPATWAWNGTAWDNGAGGTVSHGSGNLNDRNIIQQVAYNERGNIRLTRDVTGQVTLFGYDAADRVIKQVVNAQETAYDNSHTGDFALEDYPGQDKSLSATADQDLITQYRHDPNGNVMEVKQIGNNNNARTTLMGYDPRNRLTRTVVNPSQDYIGSALNNGDYDLVNYVASSGSPELDVVEDVTYDLLGRVIKVSRSIDVNQTNVILYGYNALNQVVRMIEHASMPDGTYTPNLSDYMPSNEADEDHDTQYVYDVENRLESVIHPDGTVTRYVYDGLDRQIMVIQNFVTQMTMPEEWIWRDVSGTFAWRLSSSNDGIVAHGAFNDQNLISRIYYSNGRADHIRDVEGLVTKQGYDSAERLTVTAQNYTGSPTSPIDNTTMITPGGSSYTHDSDGLPLRSLAITSDDRNIYSKSFYDVRSRVEKTRDTFGNETHYVYDALDRPILVVENYRATNESVPAQAYGSIDQWFWTGSIWTDGFIQIEHGTNNDENIISEMIYDVRGNLTDIRDVRGRVTKMIYDELDRVVAQTENYTQNVSYNTDENITVRIDYDKFGDIIRQIDPNGVLTAMAYDRLGRLKTRAIGDSREAMIYDKYQLLRTQDGNGNATTLGFDNAQRLNLIRNASYNDRIITYDKMGRVITEEDFIGIKTRYAYDGVGRLTTVVKNYAGTDDPNTWSWNGSNWVDGASAIIVSSPDQIVIVRLEYDTKGRLIAMRDPNGNLTVYTYDKLGRVIAARQDSGVVQFWLTQYEITNQVQTIKQLMPADVAGDWIVRSTDQLGRLANITYADVNTPNVGMSYDTLGNMTQMSDGTGTTAMSMTKLIV